MSVLSLLVLLVLSLLATLAVVLHRLADMLLRPPRMTDGKAMYVLRRMSPGDLGLPFEPLAFSVRHRGDSRPISIAAWWIAATSPSSRTCVLIHGFADAKVGALAWAPLWRELGWNLLLIDLRAHGESGGTLTTGGFYERDDLDAVVDELRAARPAQTEHIALFGISLGGAVALATAARRDDIDAVVTDSVFADYARAAVEHGRRIAAPLPSLTPLAILLAERIAGARFADVRPVDTVRTCRCPVMLVHGDADLFVNPTDVEALADSLRSRGNARDAHLRVAGAAHCLAIVADAHNYRQRLQNFLESALADSVSASAGSTTHA